VVDSGTGFDFTGRDTSLQLTPSGWPAISYSDYGDAAVKYAYKSAS